MEVFGKSLKLILLVHNIRQLYLPVQPTIRQSADNVSYQEFLPELQLQPFIYCYWQLKTTQPLAEAFNYRVVADGCIDIFFEVNQPKYIYAMGFCKKYTQFPLDNDFHYFGIRFLPTMFPQFFKIPAHEISNKFVELEDVLPKTTQFIQNELQFQKDTTTLKNKLDQYLLEQLHQMSFDEDSRLYDAITIILKNFGVLNIEKDLNTGISPRQLRRIFKHYVGDTAKTFSKVVRFQNILRAKPSKQSLQRNKLFYEGYFDQAHFIKEFKNFYGVTPGTVYKR